MAEKILGIVVIFLIFLGIVVWNGIGFYARWENESLRATATQRLNLDADRTWQEIEMYLDCQYLPKGIQVEELLLRASHLDAYLVTPYGAEIAYKGTIPVMDFSRVLTFELRNETYYGFNRLYGINHKEGTVAWVSTIPTGLDSYSEEIVCR